jgi:hypothetical protein
MGGLLLAACVLSLAADFARADEQPSSRRNPRRFTRGSYTQYVPHMRRGQVQPSKVYNGYRQGFPPPAFLYYGYPHSGDENGIGPLTRK